MAPAIQTTYSERMAPGAAGQVADMTNYDAETRTVENSNGVPFGRAVGRGTADKGCRLGAAAVTDFLGLSIRDTTLLPTADSDYVDEYPQGKDLAAMTRGVMWVIPNGNVTDGADVTFDSLTGQLSTAGTSGTQFLITGARWVDTALSGKPARVRLSGHLPAA